MAGVKSVGKKPCAALGGPTISKPLFASALLILDSILVFLIIYYVPYTKIDWDAYMSQVDGFLRGERDYTKLEGDTGPLVYPAGFLYVYSAIKFITGGQVFPAQILFGILYIVNLGIILLIYIKNGTLPWWGLGLLCLSKRIHSIFMLRLFNDCFAMTLLHCSLALLLYQKWHLALIIFSGAVSIKMNVLLYAPSLFLLMLKGMTIEGAFSALLGAASLQMPASFQWLLPPSSGLCLYSISSSLSSLAAIRPCFPPHRSLKKEKTSTRTIRNPFDLLLPTSFKKEIKKKKRKKIDQSTWEKVLSFIFFFVFLYFSFLKVSIRWEAWEKVLSKEY